MRVLHLFLYIFDSDQPDEFVLLINDREFFYLVLLQNFGCLFKRSPLFGSHQRCSRHHLLDQKIHICDKTHITIRDNTDERMILQHHGNTRNAIFAHQSICRAHFGFGTDKYRIDNDTAFAFFDFSHLKHLRFDIHIFMYHADSAEPRHRDRRPVFGDGVHRRRDDRDIERDSPGKLRFDAHLFGQHCRVLRYQQNILKSQCSLFDSHNSLLLFICKLYRLL